jgi:hypothetical protein
MHILNLQWLVQQGHEWYHDRQTHFPLCSVSVWAENGWKSAPQPGVMCGSVFCPFAMLLPGLMIFISRSKHLIFSSSLHQIREWDCPVCVEYY